MIQSYPWYIADWRNSETRMSLSPTQRGLYRELLDYCYLEGSLPSEKKLLWRLAGISIDTEAALAKHMNSTEIARARHAASTRIARDMHKVLTLFSLKDGRYYHAKVDQVRQKLFCYHEQKSHAGVMSGQARRERVLNGRSAGVHESVKPTPTPTPEPAPATSSNTPMLPLSQSEYPLTITEIRKHDPAVDEIFVLRLVQEVSQSCLSSKEFPQDKLHLVNDKYIARCCAESYRSGPAKHGSGLLLKRVPPIAISWSVD